jgi:hypothetical protein
MAIRALETYFGTFDFFQTLAVDFSSAEGILLTSDMRAWS